MKSFRNIMLRLCCGAGVFSLCAGCGGGIRQPERNEWLRATAELVDEMCELARDEKAIGLFTNDSTLRRLIRKMGQPVYAEPVGGWTVELPSEELVAGIQLFAKEEGAEMPTQTELKKILGRIDPSIVISMLNNREGAFRVAAGAILMTRKTYIQPRDWRENFLLIVDYGQPYAVAAAFGESGEKTVTGTVCFVPAEEATEVSAGWFAERFGRIKGRMRKLSAKDLKQKSL